MEDSEDDADANILPQLLLVLLLTMVNAFFAMSEMAVIACNKAKINILAEDGNKKAIRVQKLNNDQTKFLSTIQVGITLAGFFSSATASVGLSDELSLWFNKMNIPYSDIISIVIITILLSFFTLIFGELLPKRIALASPEKIAMDVSRTINFIKVITSPFVKLLSGTCNLLSKLLGINKKQDERISSEEIKYVIETGVTDGTIDEEKQKMMESVLKFNDITATDIMTPRILTYMIDIDSKLKDIIYDLLDNKYSRIPVFKDTHDNIIGIINIKDLTEEIIYKGLDDVDISKILRKPLFVRERLKINKLFEIMKNTKNQIAILLDEFGGVSGIVTMEDIIEEVVGNIYDEYDDETNFLKINDFEYIVDGNTPIQEINRELDLELDENNPNYDTIAGLIIMILDTFPKEKDEVNIDNISMIVEKENKRIIKKIRIKIKQNNEGKENE